VIAADISTEGLDTANLVPMVTTACQELNAMAVEFSGTHRGVSDVAIKAAEAVRGRWSVGRAGRRR
jgi:hypothetical protein